MKQMYVLFLISLIGCTSKDPVRNNLKGKKMPSFSLLLADSITYINTADIPSGKAIVLFSFGPSCPYSRAQMEEIIEDMPSLKNIRFYIFTTWPFKEMKKFYSLYHLEKYPNIIVGEDYT